MESATDLPNSLQKNTRHSDDKTEHRKKKKKNTTQGPIYRKRGGNPARCKRVEENRQQPHDPCAVGLCEKLMGQQQGPHRPEQSRPIRDHNGNRRGSAFSNSGREQGPETAKVWRGWRNLDPNILEVNQRGPPPETGPHWEAAPRNGSKAEQDRRWTKESERSNKKQVRKYTASHGVPQHYLKMTEEGALQSLNSFIKKASFRKLWKN